MAAVFSFAATANALTQTTITQSMLSQFDLQGWSPDLLVDGDTLSLAFHTDQADDLPPWVKPTFKLHF